MNNFKFSPEKNKMLIDQRGVSFEAVIAAIEGNLLLDIVAHPNSSKYPHQKLYVITLSDYVYLVPFVEEKDGSLFLKTIIPSRKATKLYLKETKE